MPLKNTCFSGLPASTARNSDTIVICADNYSYLKNGQETFEMLNNFFESSGNLWNRECRRLQKEPNKDAEWGNESGNPWAVLTFTRKSRSTFKKMLVDMKILSGLGRHHFSFSCRLCMICQSVHIKGVWPTVVEHESFRVVRALQRLFR